MRRITDPELDVAVDLDDVGESIGIGARVCVGTYSDGFPLHGDFPGPIEAIITGFVLDHDPEIGREGIRAIMLSSGGLSFDVYFHQGAFQLVEIDNVRYIVNLWAIDDSDLNTLRYEVLGLLGNTVGLVGNYHYERAELETLKADLLRFKKPEPEKDGDEDVNRASNR
jgi:hypothetical protein